MNTGMQDACNLAWKLALVCHGCAADTLTELSIGYPHSPLTQAGPHGRHGPRAGQRAPIRAGEAPVGAGASPRFALCAAPGEASARVLAARAHLLEPAARPGFEDGAMWLVRPDGYVATTTAPDDADGMMAYLARLDRA